VLAETTLAAQAQAQQATKKPNILVIWVDNIGGFNLERVMEQLTAPSNN
jgi:hypothetical protein